MIRLAPSNPMACYWRAMSEMKCGERTNQSYLFPLYIYPDDTDQFTLRGKGLRDPFGRTQSDEARGTAAWCQPAT
jgi:hypothetical protein